MTRGEKAFSAMAVLVMLVCVVLTLTSVPGPWLSLGGILGGVSGMTLSIRASRRKEQDRQKAFAERIRSIREGRSGLGGPRR